MSFDFSASAVTRREFLAASTAGLYAAATIGPQAYAQPSATNLRIRQNALTLPPNDPVFQQYAEAVKLMHELPANDRRSWRRQAEIHPNHCPHGTVGFLPWHRHYINEFEKICGQLIGDQSFALPYWDWTTEGGKIPDAFFDIAELNVTHWNDAGDGQAQWPDWSPWPTRGVRGLSKGDRAQDDPVRGGNFTRSRIEQIKRTSQFSLFWGQLEGSPHNSGHVVVGLVSQPPMGHMISGLSPLDPLFWLHHCNVDRIWAEWQLAGNSTPSFNQNYNGQFVGADGNPINVTADASINFELLGFSYDTIETIGSPREFLRIADIPAKTALSATDVAEPKLKILASATVTEPLTLNTPFAVQLSVDQLAAKLSERHEVRNAVLPEVSALKAFKGRPEEALSGFGVPRSVRKSVYALIDNARSGSHVPPSVNVYLNCPYLTPETPYTDQHFAGSFSFFGHAGGHHANGHEGQNFVVDITDAVERLGLVDEGNLKVQLLPVVPQEAGGDANIRVQAIKIVST
jgi:tyrosinase